MFDEAALPPHSHALMQDPAFARALRFCGQRPIVLPSGLMLLQQRLAGVPVLMLPRAAPPPDLRAQLRDAGLHRRPLILSPEEPCALPTALHLSGPRLRAVMDLSQGPTARRAALHPKWRNQLRKAELHEFTLCYGPLRAHPTEEVLMQECRQSKARGYANWPAQLTAAFAAMAPNQTHLLRVSYKNRTVAHMLFMTHGTAATYHIGHITEEGKKHAAHNLLLWKAAEYLAHLGCLNLDLGLLDPATPGLNRFKLRSGATARKTGGTHLIWRPLA